jgi:hypothetical protein
MSHQPSRAPLTVDDLSARLSDVRQTRNERRMLKSVRAGSIWESCLVDDDGDVIMTIPSVPSSPKQRYIPDRNTPKNTFNYINKYFLLNAVYHIPFTKNNENAMCELLYDFCTFPLDQVLARMKDDGFIIRD